MTWSPSLFILKPWAQVGYIWLLDDLDELPITQINSYLHEYLSESNHIRLILHLSMRGIQEKYQLPLIRWPTWSLALVAHFNTPSQPGRTTFADLYVWLYYLCHQCPALFCSALLSSVEPEPWRRRIDRECLILFSTDSKSVSLIPDQYHKKVSQTTHTDPRLVSLILDQWRSS